MIECLDIDLGGPAKGGKIVVAELDVTAHREVGRIELQHDTGANDHVVLGLHRFGDRPDVVLVSAIVIVAEKDRDNTRRGGVEEAIGVVAPIDSGL